MSVFRFVASSRRGAYSVHRRDEWIGYVERQTYRIHGKTINAGWRPFTTERREIALEPTREAAATALWRQRAP